MLREKEITEWEIMGSLYRLFGPAMNVKEARSVLKVLIGQGFLEVYHEANRLLRVNKVGVKLLSALQKDFEFVTAGLSSEGGMVV